MATEESVHKWVVAFFWLPAAEVILEDFLSFSENKEVATSTHALVRVPACPVSRYVVQCTSFEHTKIVAYLSAECFCMLMTFLLSKLFCARLRSLKNYECSRTGPRHTNRARGIDSSFESVDLLTN